MNIKAFFVDALGSALELGIGTPDDVLRHVTPDVLSQHLPRPLWARLLTACLGAPRVDARLVVETIGIPNLCEHIPSVIIWNCISELGSRSLGMPAPAPTPIVRPAPEPTAKPAASTTPARGTPVGPSIPKPTPARGAPITAASSSNSAPVPQPTPPEDEKRARTPTGQRFRQSGTGVRTLGGITRRPQAAASGPAIARGSSPTGNKRAEPTDYETETAVESADWREREIVVDDEQLVDWQADPASAVAGAITGDDDFSDLGGRKR